MVVAPDLVLDVSAVNENSLLDPVELPVLADDLIVATKDSYHLLIQLFQKLPSMFTGTKTVESAFGPALTACISLLTPCGGKIIASVSSLPTVGDGKLQNRNDRKLYNQPKEHTMTLPNGDWYKQRSLACTQAQISVDLIVDGSSDVDLASIATISRFTSGHIYRYSPQMVTAVKQQIERILIRDTAFEAVLRVRTTTGIIVPNYYGHCYMRGPDLLALPTCDTDTSYAVLLQLTATLQAPYAFVQTALLYTTRQRERRIRVHTIPMSVSNSIPKIFNSADAIAMASVLSKMCIDYTASNPFQLSQQKITDKIVGALKIFRKNVGGNRYANQLVLPESLKLLPYFMVGFFRCPATRSISSIDTSPDERVASMSLMMTSPVDATISHWVGWTFCVYTPRDAPEIPSLELSTAESLKSDGIYVVDVGTSLVVWHGKGVDSRVLAEFGFDTHNSSLAADGAFTNDRDVADLAHRFQDILAKQQELSSSAAYTPVLRCPQGSSAIEKQVGVALLEDDVKEAMSYPMYLAMLMRKAAAE